MKRMHTIVAAGLMGAFLVIRPAVAQAQASDFFFIGINMFGENVPDGGADDASSGDFNGEFDFGQGKLCYYLEVYQLTGANGAAIYEGEEGESGTAILPLPLPASADDETCVDVDPALLRTMSSDPESYYVAVHTTEHQKGAIRAQLSD